jgi:hypothetical protein
MSLPTPKTRSGMFAGLVLTLVLFMAYYRYFYDDAYKYYIEQYVETTSESEFLKEQQLSLYLKVPKYSSRLSSSWVYGSVSNESDEEQDVLISLNVKEEDLVLIPSLYTDDDENILQRSAVLKISPHSTAYFRLQWGSNVKSNDSFILFVNKMKVELKDNVSSLPDTLKTLNVVVVQNLLLPPWSNIIIPAFAFAFCYFGERKWVQEELYFSTFAYIFVYGLLASIFSFELARVLIGKGWVPAFIGLIGWLVLLLLPSFWEQDKTSNAKQPNKVAMFFNKAIRRK